MTTTEAAQDRFTQDIFSGRTFVYASASHSSADRMSYRPMLHNSNYGQVVVALGKVASMSRLFTYAVSKALPKVSPFLTGPQIMAGIADAFGQVVRDGWTDVAAATGPEAGRASDHNHKLTEREIIFLNLAYQEVAYALSDLGTLPGVGWVLAALVAEHKINVPAHFLPNVAKVLSA